MKCYSDVRMISLEIHVITYQTTRCPAMQLLTRCPHSSAKLYHSRFLSHYPVTVLVNIVFRLMKEQYSVKLQTPKTNIWAAANESSRHLIWKLCTSPVRRSAVGSQDFLWLAGRHVGSACRLTAIDSSTLNDWRPVECDAVSSGKDLPGFRRIIVLFCRVKQLSLNWFTLKVKAIRCFETSVPRSTVPDDFDQQLLPVKRQSLWTVSPRCLLSCPSRLRSSAIQPFVGFLVAFTQIVG